MTPRADAAVAKWQSTPKGHGKGVAKRRRKRYDRKPQSPSRSRADKHTSNAQRWLPEHAMAGAATIDWRTLPARSDEAIQVRRTVIELDLWSTKDWRLHRTRMQDAARDFDALLLRDAERRTGGRPKGSKGSRKAAMNPLNVNSLRE